MDNGNGNGNGLPTDLRKVYNSFNAEQKRIYNGFPTRETKILYLKGIVEERNKSVC
jgi:hypothetical protein